MEIGDQVLVFSHQGEFRGRTMVTWIDEETCSIQFSEMPAGTLACDIMILEKQFPQWIERMLRAVHESLPDESASLTTIN